MEEDIRKLASSSYYLRLYHSAKEINNISIFNNRDNFSGLQVLFLHWLEIYSMLYKELSEKEWINLDEEVIKNNTRCDAFLYWRRKQIEKELIKYKEEMRHSNKKSQKNRNKGQTLPVWQGKK